MIKRARRPLLLAALVLTLAAAGVRGEPRRETFQIAGAVGKPGVWSAARLAKELAGEVRTVTYTLRGDQATARCVPLLALVQASVPRLEPKRKNHLLAFVVLVRADDGYTVSFSLGELLPAHGKREVYVALDRDNKPLGPDEGPVRLIVLGEEKPARSVYGVTNILLVDAAQITPK